MTMKFHVLAIILTLAIAIIQVAISKQLSCSHYNLVRYRVTFQGDWSEEKFPKQYPTVRPPAQWSKLIGRTHNSDYKLWSTGVLSKNAFKKFAQEGSSELLEKVETQGFDGIFDMFSAPPLQKGVGEMTADFLATSTHSLVSTATRIVPSPDWFVGVDSVELCPNGTWLLDATIPLNPTDAGTDRGYTFTSPKWASRPQETMHQITSQYPSHRANSFYYPELIELPNIGYMKFELIVDYKQHKVYQQVRSHREPGEIPLLEEDMEKKREEVEEQQILHGEPIVPLSSDSNKPAIPRSSSIIQYNMVEPRLPMDQSRRLADKSAEVVQPPTVKHKKHVKPTPPAQPKTVPQSKKFVSSFKSAAKPKANRNKADSGRQDCLVGEWGLWSQCSKTCGFGVQKRQRKVIQIPIQGRSCPQLEQEKWCGGMRNCREKLGLFSWLDNNNEKQHTRS